MTEFMIYELKNLMKNAKAALEIALYHGELTTLVDELNQQADPKEMSIQYMLAPLVDVTSNYIICGEAQKCQENIAEFAAQVMQIIDCFEMGVDIQLSNPVDMTYSMYLYKSNQPVIEITA